MEILNDAVLLECLQTVLAKSDSELQFILDGKSERDIQEIVKQMDAKKKRGARIGNLLGTLDREEIQELWKHLLTDAINILKWHDTREVAETMSCDRAVYKDWLAQSFGNVAYGIESLDEYFAEFVNFEQLLYGAERYYRDHFVHVIRVWLIGVMVFHRPDCVNIDSLVIDACDNRKELALNLEERYAIWTIMALCHDLGYPLQKIRKINSPLRKIIDSIGVANVNDFAFEFPRQHQFIDDFIMRFISSKVVAVNPIIEEVGGEISKQDGARTDTCENRKNQYYKTDIQSKYYLKFSKSFEEQQHGILSCVLLMKRLVYFLESDFDVSENKRLEKDDARQFLIRREILRSIATHTCSDIYHLKCNTFSFLLMICDDMQEWDRPTFHEMRGTPIGQATASLEAYNARYVSVCIKYHYKKRQDIDQKLEEHIKESFRRLHKILRSAVYVQNREFTFTWRAELTAARRSASVTFSNEKNSASIRFEPTSMGNAESWLYGDDYVITNYFSR